MKNTPEKLFSTLKTVRLEREESAEIEKVLKSKMALSKQQQALTMHPWPFFSYRHLAYVAVMVFILLLASVSYAAEDSVPGDPLYIVKTGLNEPVRGAFAITPEAKERWETRLTERREQEARILIMRAKEKRNEQEQLASTTEAENRKEEQKMEQERKETMLGDPATSEQYETQSGQEEATGTQQEYRNTSEDNNKNYGTENGSGEENPGGSQNNTNDSGENEQPNENGGGQETSPPSPPAGQSRNGR